MRAIWREAAVTRAPRFSRRKCASRFTTAAPPIARKRYSYKGFGRSDGLRSGPGDSDPNDGPAARFAADRGAGRAARYGIGGERCFRSEQASLRRAAQRPPAILIQTTIMTARIAGYTRIAGPPPPTVMCVALPTKDLLELCFGIPTKPAKGS